MTDLTSLPSSAAPKEPSRRGVLIGAGVLATTVGAGVSWMLAQPGGVTGGATEPAPGFWALEWEKPQGGVLRAQALRGRPLLINFWATWCPPCVEELPLINDFFRAHQAHGWKVVGLAVDRLPAVQSFLTKMPLDFPVGMLGADSGGLAQQLGNPSGALPFSVVVSAQGGVIQRKLGRLHAQDLDAWAQLK